MPKKALQHTHVVTKRNTLNDFRAYGVTLQELRFFVIYLAKINPKDERTRAVRFPLADYQTIMDLDKKPNFEHLKKSVKGLLQKITTIDFPNGGFESFPLFKKGKLEQDEFGEWYVEIDASDDALPLFFDVREKYLKYQLWNALRLKSVNQLRMYEILKQYEKIGYKIISVDELKQQLGIKKKQYPEFSLFKQSVLNVCQEALARYTDISFTFEPYGKKGRGGKITHLKFTITSNQGFEDPLLLESFIGKPQLLTVGSPEEPIYENEQVAEYVDRIEFFMEACEKKFSYQDMEYVNTWLSVNRGDIFMDQLKCFDFIRHKYIYMTKYNIGGNRIKHPFKYFCSILDLD